MEEVFFCLVYGVGVISLFIYLKSFFGYFFIIGEGLFGAREGVVEGGGDSVHPDGVGVR